LLRSNHFRGLNNRLGERSADDANGSADDNVVGLAGVDESADDNVVGSAGVDESSSALDWRARFFAFGFFDYTRLVKNNSP